MTDPITRLNAALEGRYRIEREIGEGGMAVVYLAEDLRHERKVALKVLKPELAAVVGAERFLAEIKTTANLQHPHILALYDSGEADSFLFFVGPYIEGETLRDKIDREKQLGIEEALKITKKVASALDYAHEHGVVHRDIKPGNILLSEKGEPTVADFGIALAVAQAGGGRVTETGLSVGTPHYMSPEQATGDRDVDPRTDIYALGSVLYEMLTGEPPYTGANAQSVLAKILTDPAPAPTKVRLSIPPNVDAAIRKALEKLAADRFPSAQELARALRDTGFRHGEEATAEFGASADLWRGVALALGALALASTMALGWSYLRPEPQLLVSRLELSLPDGLELYTNAGVSLDLSPDGENAVFVGASPGAGTQLWLRPLDQLSPVPLPDTEGARNPRFSWDGGSIALTGNNSLRTVSLDGDPSRTVVSDSVPNGFGGLSWGVDGMLYFRKSDVGIWRVPASGGDQEEVTALQTGEGGHSWLDMLPNGAGILFTRDIGGPAEDEIALLSLETGEIRVLFQGAMARYAHSGHILYTSGDGTLLAVPFDLDRLEVTGPSRAVLEGVQVLGGSPSYFAVSETGTLLYRPQSAVLGVPVWLNRDGSEEVVYAALTGDIRSPAISPDGNRIAFEYRPTGGARDIWIFDRDQGTFERLTYEGSNAAPFWSPDGTEVGFSSERGGIMGLYGKPADLSGEARLLVPGQPPGLSQATWTPDGKWLVYQRGQNSSVMDLLYAAPDPEGTPAEFLATPFAEGYPSLSPDGRFLAYDSNESGRFEVYVRPFPGPGGRTSISAAGGSGPHWARSGREIFYRGSDGLLTVATVRTDPDFQVESRQQLFDWTPYGTSTGSNLDSAPDDERLLAMRVAPGSVGTVRDILVQNFFEELRQVVPDN